MSGAVPLFPLYAFMAGTGMTLPLLYRHNFFIDKGQCFNAD